MKKIIILLGIFALISCKKGTEKEGENVAQATEGFPESYITVGEEFTENNILSAPEMNRKFQDMKVGDTINVSFKSQVNSVCKKKGCWMNLDMPNEQEVMVKFRDYSFFVPKDIEKKEVVVNGKAYVTEVSVEDQRHFAEDGGKSPEEITAITVPKKTFSFLAEGVVIEENQ